MSPITTHVLDTSLGKPASGVPISLEREIKGQWKPLGQGITNSDGRLADILPEGPLEAGTYRMTFDTGAYFHARKTETFYPVVKVEFEIRDPSKHYHIPLLLSPYGYSTYRGS